MANIIDKTAQIREAVYGKDVREKIASGIEAINTEVENTTGRQTQLESDMAAAKADAIQATADANTARDLANTAADNANTKATLADEKAILADQKATLADEKATAAQTATDNANTTVANINNNTLIIYKPWVNTFADIATTYLTPELGWTTQTKDTFTRYRFNGTEWVNIGVFTDDKIGDMGQISESNLVQAVLNDRSQLAQKVTIEPFELHVGVNQKYKTINEAFTEWQNPLTINKQPATIFIHEGTYSEKIYYTSYCNCSFIGIGSRDKVIIKTTTGLYEDAPISVQGDLIIENLTLYADYSSNSGFTETTNPGYALHIDFTGVEGTTKIKNCKLISYQNAGLGCGTRQNQTIIIEDCEIYNVRELSGFTYTYGLLYHNSSTNAQLNQNIILRNVKIHSKLGRAMMIYSYNTDTTKNNIEFYNCTFSSDAYTSKNLVYYNNSASDNVVISPKSHGNNVNEIAAVSGMYNINKAFVSLADDYTGACRTVTDCNNALYGFFKCNGASGGLNTPVPRWVDGFTIAFDSSTFVVQTVYDITQNFECYQRTKNATTWSSWKLIRSNYDYADTITDANSALTSGVHICTTNTPTVDTFMIDVIAANSYYCIQYSYRLSDMKKWKRTYINRVFGTWVEVTE